MEPASGSALPRDQQASSCQSLEREVCLVEEQTFAHQNAFLEDNSTVSVRNSAFCFDKWNVRQSSSENSHSLAASPPRKRLAQSPPCIASSGALFNARPRTERSLNSFALLPDGCFFECEEYAEKSDVLKEDGSLRVLKESLDGPEAADWNWIHELDDFGTACESIDDHDSAELPQNDSQEGSCCRDGANALEKGGFSEGASKVVSFKESFYSSGTDWSCLYSVDDYGMPSQCNDGGNVEDLNAERTLSGKVIGKLANKRVCGKLVQSSLTACWESKSVSMSRSIGSEGFASESKPMQAPVSEFWNKFKSGSVRASPVLHSINPQMAAVRRQRDVKVPSPGRKCPFYKKIPGTTFTVDAFRYGLVYGCSAYFLTHFHADHYGGLTKSWSHGPIYCTPVTARLLVLCLSVDNRWIYPVPVGATRLIEGVEVKMLEANHCPGAAIILFRLKNGQSILHTGDFRACKSMQSYPELLESHINTLFLDTTYCNPRYRFPPQKEVIDFVVQITCDALKKNGRTLIVVGAYSIGKERVYLGIAEALKISIHVERRRSRILGALDWPELANRLCTDAENTILHVLPIGFLRPEKLRTYLRSHPRFSSILAFRPTGWTYSEKIGNQLHLLKPVVSGPATIYGVPYSEHSSFTELRDFVQFLRPEKIIPTVNNGRPQARDRMQSHFRQWLVKQA